MKLLFDLNATQPNVSGKMHGGGKYAIAVFFELVRQHTDMECVYDSRLYLSEEIVKTIKEQNIKLLDLSTRSFNDILKDGEYDVFYSALPKRGLIAPEGTRMICTIHGLRELEMPIDWWALRYKTSFYITLKTIITHLLGSRWKKVLYNRDKKRLTNQEFEYVVVSNHTKYSCLSYFPELKLEQLRVCYSPSTNADVKDVKPYTTDYKYILLVSANRPGKNALRALMAIDEILTERPELRDIRVIATGATDDSFRLKFKNRDHFSLLGYVDEGTLNSLYCGAYMFVYPSLNEGFGYPPIEAMKYGVPVIASPHTSISEVCGDAALYCNPFDYKEIKARILYMLTCKECRSEYAMRGMKRFEYITDRQQCDLKELCGYITDNLRITPPTTIR